MRPAPTARSAAVEMLQVIDVLGSGTDPLKVARRMRALDVLLHVLAQRRLLAHKAAKDVVREHLVDRPHAVGALGVARARIVADERGMR